MKPFWTQCCKLMLPVVLGSMAALAFAPYSIFPFAILALSGLLGFWVISSAQQSFWQGFLFGCGFFATGVHWLYISMHFFGDIAPFMACLITLAIIIILASFIAVNGWLLSKFFPTPNNKIFFAFPALWVLFEWIRSWLFTGFPWLFIGYSQIATPLKGYASILSVYGVSLAALYTSAALYHGVRSYLKRNYFASYLNLLAIVIIWTLGSLLTLIPWTSPNHKPLNLHLIQGNIPQSIKWVPEHLQLSLDRYTELSKTYWQKDSIIIWPEAAIPMALQENEDFINFLDQKAIKSNSVLITGIPILTANETGYYNAVISLGNTRNLYLKRHLVPFGEYVPLYFLAKPILNWLQIPLFATMPGPMQQAAFVVNHIKIDVSICYEIAFPELVYTHDSDVGVLLTLTNDAWFGKSAAQAQHLQMAQMRAAELMRPVIFVSNNGITAIIDAAGNITASIPAYTTGVLNSKIVAYSGKTPWMRLGINSILILLLILIACAILLEKQKNQLMKFK